MRNPLAPKYDEQPRDRAILAAVIVVGVGLVFLGGGAVYRGWFAGAALVLSTAFVVTYWRRAWRTTYAGRATMLSMLVTIAFTGHATILLWLPYQQWETVQALIYLGIFVAAGYKLRALTRAEAARDPTV